MGPGFNLCENLTFDVQIFTHLWLVDLEGVMFTHGSLDVLRCHWQAQKGTGLRVECQFAE